jgi:hypothetical protein
MAYNNFESVQVGGLVAGSWLNSRFPTLDPCEVEMAYSGVAGSVFLLIKR